MSAEQEISRDLCGLGTARFSCDTGELYQPIPDTQSLPEDIWDRPSELLGIGMNDSVQLDLLRNRFPTFRDKYEQFPTSSTGEPSRFHLNNDLFDGTDALVAY